MFARRVEVLGAPFDSAGTKAGVAGAPGALRDAGLVDAIRATGVEVVDRADVKLGPTDTRRDPVSRVIAPAALASMIRATGAEVDAILRIGGFPLVIGGDCPILLGCLGAGGPEAPPGLLFIDGHEDAWPPQLSTTGEAADMELGLALGLNVDGLPGDLAAAIPRLDPRRVVVIGPRDRGELADADAPSIDEFVEIVRPEGLASTDLLKAGADAAARLARMGPWWLHVDLDVLSTESLEAVDYQQPGGLDWDALTRLTRGALANPDVLGWDITIYNPDLDPTGADARRIVQYAVEAMSG